MYLQWTACFVCGKDSPNTRSLSAWIVRKTFVPQNITSQCKEMAVLVDAICI